jgi:hypothetical protein
MCEQGYRLAPGVGVVRGRGVGGVGVEIVGGIGGVKVEGRGA